MPIYQVCNLTTGALVTVKAMPASQIFLFAVVILITILIAMTVLSEFRHQCAAWQGCPGDGFTSGGQLATCARRMLPCPNKC